MNLNSKRPRDKAKIPKGEFCGTTLDGAWAYRKQLAEGPTPSFKPFVLPAETENKPPHEKFATLSLEKLDEKFSLWKSVLRKPSIFMNEIHAMCMDQKICRWDNVEEECPSELKMLKLMAIREVSDAGGHSDVFLSLVLSYQAGYSRFPTPEIDIRLVTPVFTCNGEGSGVLRKVEFTTNKKAVWLMNRIDSPSVLVQIIFTVAQQKILRLKKKP